jgi:hypothetical protein
MKLTSDYKHVTALFDTPAEEIRYATHFESTTVEFEVGPFTYVVKFGPDDENGRVIRVEFQLADIHVSDQELVKMMSKIKKGFTEDRVKNKEEKVEEVEEPLMSLQEARTLKSKVLNNHSYDEVEITGPYIIKIFGYILNIIKDYVKRYRPRCIVFSADSKDRERVYYGMMKRTFPGAGIRTAPSPWGAGTEFRVCFT